MMPIPEFSCPVHTIDDLDYDLYRYQYATTSQPDTAMYPAFILYPQSPNADADVEKAIAYAAANGLAIAVRTGGHAYSGTSSTNSQNIQIDLSDAYNEWEYDQGSGLLRFGVSYSLLEFNTKLKQEGLFMPTGQCYNVHVGGHAQTGGYGQLSRAFGLFGDQIVSFEIFLADGTQRTIGVGSTEPADKDLFFAVLGGGPGNYGLVTHITIRPFKDEDHKHARALKQVIPYDPNLDHDVLVKLFDLVQEWENAPGDYDFCFTIASAEEDFIANQIGLASKDDFMITFFGGKNGSSPFNILVVFFQYSNLDNSADTYDPTWCDKIKAILGTANTGGSWWKRFEMWGEEKLLQLITRCDEGAVTPISKSVTELWTYNGTREFNYPFLKNGQVTDKVAMPSWSQWAATRIDEMTGCSEEGLMVIVQCQNFGGKNSAITKNSARKQTAYAWRDTTVGYSLDLFFDPAQPGAKARAQDWQSVNTCEGIGPQGQFSATDHRWFWASHGDLDMSKAHKWYYSPDDYAKCCAVKAAVDPKGVFTPNTFVVGYASDDSQPHLAVPMAAPEAVTASDELPTASEGTVAGERTQLSDATFAKEIAARAPQRAQEKGVFIDLASRQSQ